VGQPHGAVVSGVAPFLVTGLRHPPACVDIHPVWHIHRVLFGYGVTIETPTTRSLKLGLTSLIRQWGLV
jgi:hypothetical protein